MYLIYTLSDQIIKTSTKNVKKKSFDEFLKLFKFPLIGGLLVLFELFVNTVDRVLPTELNQSGNFADGT